MSRDLRGLHPYVRTMALRLIDGCKEHGIVISIMTTIRTLEEQKELYDLGRKHPGEIVTYRTPGNSYHQYGLAFDIMCSKLSSDIVLDEDGMYSIAGRIGKSVGLGWGGDRKGEGVNHFFWTGGLSMIDLKFGDLPDCEGKKEQLMKREYYKKKTDYDVMVRDRKSLRSCIVGIIQKGNPIKVFDEDESWVEVSFLGRTAYICKKSLK